MDNNSQTMNIGDWVVRTRLPDGDGPHPVLLMVHGWTGDENSMWIFTGRLPKNAFIIAPRALYATPLGGFAWHPHRASQWPGLEDFSPAVEALRGLLTTENFPQADFSRMDAMGFSQGAALLYSLTLLYPASVGRLAGLAGFMPEGVELVADQKPLLGKPVFVAHGTQDEMVPLERARHAVEMLDRAGAEVHYCEDNVSHKLSATCFRGLGEFFK